MGHIARVAGSGNDRLSDVIDRLPPGPFSLRDVVDHAIGLNALDHQQDVAPFLDQLVRAGTVHRLGKNIALWVLATDESCCLA